MTDYLPKLKPKKDSSVIGLTLSCPQCGSQKTYYSGGGQLWVCRKCGYKFDPHAKKEV